MSKTCYILILSGWAIFFAVLSGIALAVHQAFAAFIFGWFLGAGVSSIVGFYHYFRIGNLLVDMESEIRDLTLRIKMSEIKLPVYTNEIDDRPTIH